MSSVSIVRELTFYLFMAMFLAVVPMLTIYFWSVGNIYVQDTLVGFWLILFFIFGMGVLSGETY